MINITIRQFLIILILLISGRTFLEVLHFNFFIPNTIPQWQLILMYGIVLFSSVIILVLNIRKYGYSSSAKYAILIIVGLFLIAFYGDFGKNYFQEWKSEREYRRELELQASTEKYYKDKLKSPYQFIDYIWYSNLQTFYVFEKQGGISKQDIIHILNILKPLDNLDISIQLISQTTEHQLVMRFTNRKELIGCSEPPFYNLDKINICKE